ncbi:NACHT domain-containing protein [Streptomyces sp. NPDC029216]|uniref:NACHT domain-containing protein n=1 Tax=Streptomyces sp. NPDC029216 TaxID=3154701 RepID=UPI0033C8E174
MSVGRPRTSGRQSLPELADLAEWFEKALGAAGYASPNAFLTSRRNHHARPLPDKNALYAIRNALALPSLETIRHLAEALGSPPETAASHWLRASRALARRELARRNRPTAPAPTWESLPPPSPLLEDLLRSQASAAEQFPYDLLGVRKPPLSEIYVEQDFQPLAPAASPLSAQRHHQDTAPTLAAVLSRHDHLFITGGPGAGKTTLGRHLVHQIARYWLCEEDAETPWCPAAVVAVRVTASDLLTPHPWSLQLSHAVGRAGTLLSPVDRSHFEVRPHGAPWLVVVDGLDEVASPAVRQRLLDKLAEQIRPHGPCRLLITSRPLPQEELKPFAGLSGLGFYTLKGFDSGRQRTFAARWFAAQGDAEPERQAEEFLADVADASLEDVLQVPLLATIAAAFRSRNPGRPLPRGRVELYEMFLADLKNAREGNATVLDRFLERWTLRGYGKMAEWLTAHQERLLTHLAWKRTAKKPPASLLDEALEWLDRHLPTELEWPPGARGELGQFLAQSGVVSFDGDEVSFLHQSFAEFLAARDAAAAIPSDFPRFDQWSEEITNSSSGNRILFTLALWARRPGNDVAVIVRRLLAGKLGHRIMALRLVTAGVPLGEALETAVIDRLLDFSHDPEDLSFRPGHNVLAELAQLRGHRRLAERLHTIARTEGLDLSHRGEAAWAYARVANVPEGVRLLKSLTESDDDEDEESRLACYRHLESLDPQEAPSIAGRLRALVTDPDASLWGRLAAASRLLELGSTDGLTELARTVLSESEVDGRHLWSAGELWYDVAGPGAAPEVAATIAGRRRINSWEVAGLAMVLFRFDLPEQAIPLARRAFSESIVDDEISELVELWLELRGARGADEIAAMMPGLRNWNVENRDSIAFDLRLQGFTRQAADIIRTVLREKAPRMRRSAHELSLLLARGGSESTAEVLSWLNTLAPGPDETAQVLRHRLDGAAPAETVLPLARKVLHHPGCRNDACAMAASVLLRHGGPDTCDEILAALQARPHDGAALRARLLPILADHDEAAAVLDLGARMLADPGITSTEMTTVVRAWLRIAGRTGVHEVVKRIEAACHLTTDQAGDLAALLLELGHPAAAVPLWCRICTTPGTAVETRWNALRQLITADAETPAAGALRSALAVAHDPTESLTLRRLLAWLTAAE